MANYIKTLEKNVRDKQLELDELKDVIQDLVRYVQSDKFLVDTKVEKTDILTRLGRY